MEMKYVWLLFDADGTLFDYDHAEETALKNTFAQSGFIYQLEYLNIYKTINSKFWKEFEKNTIQRDGLKTERFKALFNELKIYADPFSFSNIYLNNLSLSTLLLEGAEEICRILSKRYNLAIITNGFKEVQRPRYESSSLINYFKEIIISDEIGAAKPEKEYFDIAFERIGNPAKSTVLVIGDSLTSDIKGGLDYGLDTCWYNPNGLISGNNKIKFEIHSLKELLSFL